MALVILHHQLAVVKNCIDLWVWGSGGEHVLNSDSGWALRNLLLGHSEIFLFRAGSMEGKA